MQKNRCDWSLGSPQMIKYHDTEWGTPQKRDIKLFEALVLDSFQAGLSWSTILNKRKNFKKSFDNYNIKKIARYNRGEVARLLLDKGIVRNRLKIQATIENAKAVILVKKEFGSFSNYMWKFVGDRAIQNSRKKLGNIPATTELSETISKDMKKRGFRFVGPTTIYALMQGVGMVNDHLVNCFRHKELIDENRG